MYTTACQSGGVIVKSRCSIKGICRFELIDFAVRWGITRKTAADMREEGWRADVNRVYHENCEGEIISPSAPQVRGELAQVSNRRECECDEAA